MNFFAFYKCDRAINCLGNHYKKPKLFLFVSSIIVLLLLYSLRGNTGTDTSQYNWSYDNIINYTPGTILFRMHDPAFYFVQWLNHYIFNGSYFWNNFIIGVICYLPVMITYIKYSGNYKLALWFYIISALFFFGFNGQRQAVAMGIVFCGLPLLIKKKYVWYLLVILIANQFHSTAVFMIPFTLLITRKTDSKIFIVTSALILVSSIFLWQLWGYLFDLLGVLGQDRIVEEYGDTINHAAGTGTNVLRVMVYMAPAILGCLFYKRLQKKDENYYILLNNAILGALLMFTATKTWYFARIATYFSYTMPILLIRLSYAFNKKSRKVYYLIVSILFLIYLYFYLQMDSDLIPYKFNFTERIY